MDKHQLNWTIYEKSELTDQTAHISGTVRRSCMGLIDILTLTEEVYVTADQFDTILAEAQIKGWRLDTLKSRKGDAILYLGMNPLKFRPRMHIRVKPNEPEFEPEPEPEPAKPKWLQELENLTNRE